MGLALPVAGLEADTPEAFRGGAVVRRARVASAGKQAAHMITSSGESSVVQSFTKNKIVRSAMGGSGLKGGGSGESMIDQSLAKRVRAPARQLMTRDVKHDIAFESWLKVGNEPTVYVGPHIGVEWSDTVGEVLKGLPHFAVPVRDAAQFEFTCCLNTRTVSQFLQLPPRPPTRPYLIWSRGFFETPHWSREFTNRGLPERLLMERLDFVFVNFDLREAWLLDNSRPPNERNRHTPMRGVTMAPPRYYTGRVLDPQQPPRHFLTFRGRVNDGFGGSAHVRSDIKAAFANLGRADIVVEFVGHQGNGNTIEDKNRYNDLLDTAYALVPHGDLRWNFRFSEVVGACAIPVVIADGITWPFAQLINWTGASVWPSESWEVTFNYASLDESRMPTRRMRSDSNLFESVLLNPQILLRHLPTQPEIIKEMRRRVCEINDAYFKTDEKRVAALLRSAAVSLQMRRT